MKRTSIGTFIVLLGILFYVVGFIAEHSKPSAKASSTWITKTQMAHALPLTTQPTTQKVSLAQ